MSFQLVRVYSPFDKSNRRIEQIPIGEGTLGSVVRNNLPAEMDVVASINGTLVEEGQWDSIFIQEGDIVVCNPVLQGGDDGRQILAIVAMVVISIYAPGVGVALFEGLTTTSLANVLITAAVVAGGAFLVNSLLPPPGLEKLDQPNKAFGFNPQTIQRQGAPIPHWYGVNKVFGNIISAYSLPTRSNNKQTLRTKIALGYGPMGPDSEATLLASAKINGQDLSNFSNVAVNWRQGLATQTLVPGYDISKSESAVNRHVVGPAKPVAEIQLITKDVKATDGTYTITYSVGSNSQTTDPIAYNATTATIQTELEDLSNLTSGDVAVTQKRMDQGGSTKLTFANTLGDVQEVSVNGSELIPSTILIEVVEKRPGRKAAKQTQTVTTTSGDFDAMEVDLGFPSGLYRVDNKGEVVNFKVKIGIEYKKTTDGSYTHLNAGEIFSGSKIKGISVGGDNYPKITFRANETKAKLVDSITDIHKDDMVYFLNMGGMVELNGNQYTVIKTGIDYYTSGRRHIPYQYWIKLDVNGSAFTPYTSGGTMQAVRDTIKDKLVSNVRRTYALNDLVKGSNYDVRVTKYTIEKFRGSVPHGSYGQKLMFLLIREILEDGPFTHPLTAYVGIDALATEQISGALSFSCRVTGKYIRTYDGTNWGIEISHNPAWVLFDILTQPVIIGATSYAPKGSALIAEIQKLDTDVNATGGTFTLTYRGQTTSALAWNASTGAIQTALELLDSVTAGDIVVSGTGVNTASSDLVFTFLNSLGDAPLMTSTLTALTPTVTGTLTQTTIADMSVARYDGLNPTKLEIDAFKDLADFCSASVYGGEERIRFNGGFDEKTSLWAAALKVCEIARCGLIWNGSKIGVAIDQVASPVQMFSVGNIIENSFEEEFLPQDSRASELDVTYLDEARDFERITFSMINPTLTKLSSKSSLNLFGLTKYSEVWRAARYRLLQNQYINRLISFTAEIDAIACIIGDVISFQHDVPEWGNGGRVASNSETTSTLQIDGVVAASGGTDKVILRLNEDPIASGSGYVDRLEERTVSSITSGGTVINVSSPFNTVPKAGDVWMFGQENLSVRKYRVVGMDLTQDQKARIYALEYNVNVYSADDLEPVIVPVPSTPDPNDLAITNLSLSTSAKIMDGVLYRNIHVTFDLPVDSAFKHAEIYIRAFNEENWDLLGITLTNGFLIPNRIPNVVYTVKVVAVDIVGRKDSFEDAPSEEIVISDHAPKFISEGLSQSVAGISLLNNPNSNTFTGKDAKFTWHRIASVNDFNVPAGDSPAGNIGPNTWVKDYEVVIKNTSGTIRRTEYVMDNAYIYSLEKNSEDGTLVRNFKIEVRARDESGRKSSMADSLTVNNPKPVIPTNLVMSGFYGAYRISWDKSDDLDIKGYKVWVSTTSPVSMVDGNLIYDGPDNIVNVTQDTVDTYYARVAGYDDFGETSLNVAVEVNATTLNPVGADGDDGDDGADGADGDDGPQGIAGLQGWTSDAVWTSTDADTVSWTSGKLNFSDGNEDSLLAGSTGNMSALTYIYYDGTGTVQKTTDAAIAMGDKSDPNAPLLLGVAINNAGISEIQKLDTDVNATEGTFKLTYLGQQTADIAWNASTSAIEDALELLSTVTAGDIVVSGTGVNNSSSDLVFTFLNSLGDTTLITSTLTSLIPTVTGTVAEELRGALGQATFQMFGGTGGETMLLTTKHLAANTVTANEIAGNTITANELTTGTFVTSSANIGTGVIASANIGDLEVKTANIGLLTVGGAQMSDDAASRFGAGQLSGGVLPTGGYDEYWGAVIDHATGLKMMATYTMFLNNTSSNRRTVTFNGIHRKVFGITAIDQVAKKFSVLGDQTAEIDVAGTINVIDSHPNNGAYTVSSRTYVDSSTTEVVVDEAIPHATAGVDSGYLSKTGNSSFYQGTYSFELVSRIEDMKSIVMPTNIVSVRSGTFEYGLEMQVNTGTSVSLSSSSTVGIFEDVK